ncbi:GNAT family N-acetyltransferase [Chitinophaga sp. Mgbs1]|uniref:GNAT family N-acetyltransferase n=1 Tax=Chitinophaga solisilvae TaxID=1233460 RepID=A0A3S1BID1_9BACT|nr:GNAT family N-acetyltransferase [Chitinophaga solisilvae]
MISLQYGEATTADRADILELSCISYASFAAQLTPEHRETLLRNQGDEKLLAVLMAEARTFICSAGEQLVGVVFLVPAGKATPVYPADWAYIRRLAVHPDFRRRGIGRQLMEMVIVQARAAGEKILGLHTSTLMPEARRMYDQLGFELVRELPVALGQQYWLYRMEL